MAWAGFTDSDLQKLKGSNSKHEVGTSNESPPSVRLQTTAQRKPSQPRRTMATRGPPQKPVAPLDKSMMLSQPKPAEIKTNSLASADGKLTGTGTGNSKLTTEGNTGVHGHATEGTTEKPEGTTEQPPTDPPQPAKDEYDDMVVDDKEIFKHEKHTMESFQKQQKMIEELNRKKKQMLSKAILDRSKKAKAESVKLTELQRELARLDHELTVDVSIIRDKIENSCREFFEAQKRYDRAEKEFIESKIDLHKKMDTKEALTEHLYTVIYQNEMRKSKKLAELMRKLEMVDDEEDTEILECTMPHPSLISPIQLPAGRYGQIGPVRIPPVSPTDATPVPTENNSEKTEDKTATDKTESNSVDDKTTNSVIVSIDNASTQNEQNCVNKVGESLNNNDLKTDKNCDKTDTAENESSSFKSTAQNGST